VLRKPLNTGLSLAFVLNALGCGSDDSANGVLFRAFHLPVEDIHRNPTLKPRSAGHCGKHRADI